MKLSLDELEIIARALQHLDGEAQYRINKIKRRMDKRKAGGGVLNEALVEADVEPFACDFHRANMLVATRFSGAALP